MKNDPTEATYRILDANANRASEGLRTLEEYTRFILEDAGTTEKLKELRHDFAAAIGRLPRHELLRARDTDGDVGTNLQAAGEYKREQLSDVIAAATSRTQQSLRALEEYGKTIDAGFAKLIEQIRYRSYTISKQLELSIVPNARKQLLAAAQLYALVSAGKSEEKFAKKVRLLYESGVHILQLRDRDCNDRTLFQRASLAAAIAKEANALFIVNDRCDIAAASDADGVHVGQDELPAAAARKIIGADRLLGISTHDIPQVRAAIAEGADYIGCGPVFPGNTKCFSEYVGPTFLSEVHASTKSTPIPAFAIGGITLENLPEVLAAGFHRVAVTGAIRDAADPAAAARVLNETLAEALPQPSK